MIQLIRGFKDILPEEIALWQYIEKTAATIFEDFGFREIRIPIMERTELFARSIGENTDIVEKEMYTLDDRKGDQLTLRPEATASIVRAYIQHKMYAPDPVRKLFTIGPMFRRERPQKGRYRQFYQIDAEVFGVASPYIDAQLIIMLSVLFDRLKIKDIHTHINSLGCPECRPKFKKVLDDFISSKIDRLCTDCNRRKDRNPLRVLDCKVPSCREAMVDAPALIDHICDACRDHFTTVRDLLDAQGVEYIQDKKLVRGLDYYTRTTFEIQTGALGAQSAIAGGGRYDGLVNELGGPKIPAIGFAIGFDRLVEVARQQQQRLDRGPDVFIAALGEKCREKAFDWSCRLNRAGFYTDMELSDKSLKSQMKRANRLQAARVLILGENELAAGEAILRNMDTKEQIVIPMDQLVKTVKDHIRNTGTSQR
jgi:histidyl-tRNA synthetase